MRSTAVLLTFVTLAACSTPAPPAPDFDLVVANGRVIDPESRLDAVRHLGIRGARIEAVSETPSPRRGGSTPPITSSRRASSTTFPLA